VTYLSILRAQLPRDEGTGPMRDGRYFPYPDTAGKVTIGIGRNLTDVGIGHDECDLFLANDIAQAEARARKFVPNFDALDDARRAAVCNMAFNLGDRLGGFTDTLAAIREGRWSDAASMMLASRWAMQVGARARRLSVQMQTGEVPA
jgi:lysozyme